MVDISVLIPVYNVENYLARCLDSVLEQDFSGTFEVICVNDGSDDKSGEILEEYATRYPNLKIITQENQGLSVARNVGVEAAQGEYVMFVDSDDYIAPNAISELYNFAQKHNSEVVIFDFVRENYKTGETTKITNDYVYKKFGENTFNIETADKYVYNNIKTMTWCKFYRRDFIKNLKFVKGIRAQDKPHWALVYTKAKRINYLPKVFYYYTTHREGAAMMTPDISAFHLFDAQQLMNNIFKETDYYEKLKNILYVRFVSMLVVNIQNISKNLRKKYIDKIKKFDWDVNYDDFFNEKFHPIEKNNMRLIKYIREHDYKEICNHMEQENLWKNEFSEQKQRDFKIISNTVAPDYQKEFLSIAKKNSKIDNLIISLTSYPARINTVNQTIETLLNQSVKPDKIILWLGEDKFPNKEKDLPQQLLDLISRGLTIDWCKDIKSYTKLIPTLKKYPNAIIVTADDDLLYKTNWLEELFNAYIQKPEYVHCHRAHYVTFEGNKILPYKKWKWNISNQNPSFNNFCTGCGGTLYPPNCFHKDILREDLFMNLCPQADDIWFWAMLVLNNKKINIVTGNQKLQYINGTQEKCLWQSNINEGQNDIQLKNVMEYYPELLKKLDKDNSSYDFQIFGVSIIIPVYNVEKYLERCLNSVVRQYFPKDKYEIICIDDGSTDNSLQILENYAKQYPNIKIITPKKNKNSSNTKSPGPGEARNIGIKNAKGKYVLFVDSDDFIALNSLEVLYNYAEKNNSEVVVFDFYRGKPGIEKPQIRHLSNVADKYEHNQFNADTADEFVYRFIPVAPWNKFYRLDLLKNFKFNTKIYFQDVPYWDMVYTNAKRINYLPYVLYYYDVTRDDNITSSKGKKLFDVFKAFNDSRKILKKNGYYERFKYIMYAHATCNMVKHLKNINEDLREDFINEIKKFKIDVSVEDFLTHDFFEFEYENFKHIKFIQENDYASILEYLKNQNIF